MINQTSRQLPLVIGQQQQQLKVNSIPSTSNSHPKKRPPALPSQELFTTGTREYYLKNGVPLYEASIKGDWKVAQAILDKNPQLVRCSLTEKGDAALHVAVLAKKSKLTDQFVKNLVHLMDKDDLLLENQNYNTAFYLAAVVGNLEAVRIMVSKNRTVLTTSGGQMMPCYTAALFGNYEVVKYLYEISNKLGDDGWTHQNRGGLLEKCVENNMFDIAIQILNDSPELAASGGALRALARKPKAFSAPKSGIISSTTNVFKSFYYKEGAPEKESNQAVTLLRIIWEAIAKKPKKEIDDILRGPPNPLETVKQDNKDNMPPPETQKTYSSQIPFVAAELGNTEFIVELIRQYPDLIWMVNDENETIFHIAVKHRQEGIYNLLYEIGGMKDLIALLKGKKNGNNMLHLAGKVTKSKGFQEVRRVAFQMQRELLWFREVESIMPPSYRDLKNKDGLKPHELFTIDHKYLVERGETWLKQISSQCMIVAPLISTIAFAAAFTVPGGYNQNDGIPIFYHKVTFMVFVVADAISLFSSSASILTFLAILTSHYVERDFAVSLPKRLMYGVITLYISIVTMMITFCVSFFILYHNDLKWMPIFIAALASFLLFVYAVVQFPHLIDVFLSTYGSRYLFNRKKQVLYYRNPMH